MTVMIFESTRLEPFPAKDLDVYFGAATVRDHLGKEYPEIHSLINKLEDYFNGVIIQDFRIRSAQSLGNALLMRAVANPFDRSKHTASSLNMKRINLDVHFYCICVDKMRKLFDMLMSRISKLGEYASDKKSLRKHRDIARRRLETASGSFVDARNYLEHQEKEIAAGHLTGPQTSWDDISSIYTYGANGESIDLRRLDDLREAYKSMLEYIRQIPPRQ